MKLQKTSIKLQTTSIKLKKKKHKEDQKNTYCF